MIAMWRCNYVMGKIRMAFFSRNYVNKILVAVFLILSRGKCIICRSCIRYFLKVVS